MLHVAVPFLKAVLGVVVLLTALSPPSSPSAPAPRPKPPRPLKQSDLVGLWKARWNAVDCAMRFGRDGGYDCHWHGEHWIGSWAYRDGVLTIHERRRQDDSPDEREPLRFVRQPDGSFRRGDDYTLVLIARISCP